jgi:hypothetical protein
MYELEHVKYICVEINMSQYEKLQIYFKTKVMDLGILQ